MAFLLEKHILSWIQPTKILCNLSARLSTIATVSQEQKPDLNININTTTYKIFTEFGFSPHDLNLLISRCPRLIRANPEPMKSKLERLKSFGFSQSQVIKLTTRSPRILTTNLHTTINPNIETLEKIFKGKINLTKAILKVPKLLSANINNNLNPSLKALKQCGITDEDIHFLIMRNPGFLIYNENTICSKLGFIVEAGFGEGSAKGLLGVVAAFVDFKLSKLREKVCYLEKLGFEKEEVKIMFSKLPSLMNSSCERWRMNVEFMLSCKVGYDVIARNPVLLKYSLEKNLRPRYEVLRHVKGVGGCGGVPSFETACKMSEKGFDEWCRRNGGLDVYKEYRMMK